jgi:hypothetical protein
MKNPSGILFLSILLIGAAACSGRANTRPEDFSLSLYWNTGALPPQYRYSYSINLQSTGQGIFEYQAGYEKDEEHYWQADFSLSDNQMDTLYRYLLDNDLLRSDWQTGRPLMGGKGTGIDISANGENFSIPSVSELEQKERDVVQETIEAINELVPQEIWNEMDARQDAYENNY